VAIVRNHLRTPPTSFSKAKHRHNLPALDVLANKLAILAVEHVNEERLAIVV
jgi:hypothetical protein